MSAWPTMYLIQSVNYSISSQDLWFLLGFILPFFGGVGTIPASGRGVPSLFRGSFQLFLSHRSNVTTIILLLEIALAFMDAAQLWSSCQVKSLLCSFQSPLLWALWLISYRAEVTVIVHLLVLLKLPFQTKLNQTKPNQTKLLFLLTLEWVQIWLSRNTLFPSTMGLSTRARLSIPTSISSIFQSTDFITGPFPPLSRPLMERWTCRKSASFQILLPAADLAVLLSFWSIFPQSLCNLWVQIQFL